MYIHTYDFNVLYFIFCDFSFMVESEDEAQVPNVQLAMWVCMFSFDFKKQKFSNPNSIRVVLRCNNYCCLFVVVVVLLGLWPV